MRNQFQKGACVWAKLRDDETWPARVLKYQVDPNKHYTYEVWFFNDNKNTADIEPQNLFDFLKFKDKFGNGQSAKSRRGKAIADAERYCQKNMPVKIKSKSIKEPRDQPQPKQAKEVKEVKEVKQPKPPKQPKTTKQPRQSKSAKHAAPVKGVKESKRSAQSKGRESRPTEPEVIESGQPVVETQSPARTQKPTSAKRERSARQNVGVRIPKNTPKIDVEEMKSVEPTKPQRHERMEPVSKEKKEAITAIVHDVSKELGAHDEDLLKGLMREVLSDRRLGRDENLRRHESEWFEVVFNVLNDPLALLRENKEAIQKLVTYQRRNQLETHDLFFSTKTYVYLKYLNKVLEHIKEVYQESYEMVRDEVQLLGKAYDDNTMSTKSLDISFDTKFFQEPLDSAYQQLRRAGMLQLRLPNNLNAKFAFQGRELLTREGIRLEDALANIANFAQVHAGQTQANNTHEQAPRDLTERDIKEILTFKA